MTAVAMATPGMMVKPFCHLTRATVPAIPEKMAISRSIRFGLVRARISGVNSLSGESQVAKAAMPMTSSTLRKILVRAFFPSCQSARVSASPQARIGPIRGEISIAPMMTAGLLVNNPKSAIRQARNSMSR